MFERFLKEKQYLCNISPKTVDSYRWAYLKFSKYVTDLNKESLTAFVVGMRDEGMSPGGCNVYIRSVNSYLSWCFENGITKEHLRIKLLKKPSTAPHVISDKDIRIILNTRSSNKRLHTLILLILDTGIRINEALALRWEDIDFDNLLVSIVGKGDKVRIIPFSIELRKVLYKFKRTSKHQLVFCTRDGGRLEYHNMRRDFIKLLPGFGFHDLRRYFATHFIRQNGNPFILQRLLGHSSISTTQIYQRLVTEDLTQGYQGKSVLARR